MRRGIFFAFDAVVSFVLLLLSLYLVLYSVLAAAGFTAEFGEKEALKEKAVISADLLVKNNFPEQPEKGSAVYNAEKRRIESNVLDEMLFEKALASGKGVFEGKAESSGKKCFSAERLALKGNNLTVAGVIACEG